MPSNLRLSATLRADAAANAETRPSGAALAAIMRRAADDYLLGKERWNPRDVCPRCCIARADNGTCWCPEDL